MAPSTALDEVLAANKAYLSSGQHAPDMKLGVSRRLVVLTCMDSRWGGGCRVSLPAACEVDGEWPGCCWSAQA